MPNHSAVNRQVAPTRQASLAQPPMAFRFEAYYYYYRLACVSGWSLHARHTPD